MNILNFKPLPSIIFCTKEYSPLLAGIIKNIFKGISTWPWIGIKIQIDHILVPEHIEVKKKEVLRNRYHSDHRMLLTEINI